MGASDPGEADAPLNRPHNQLLVVSTNETDALTIIKPLQDGAIETTHSPPDLSSVITLCGRRWPDLAVVHDPPAYKAGALLHWLRFRARVPALLLTRLEQLDVRLMAIRLGVEDHAILPVHPTELVLRVRSQLQRRSRSSARIAGDLALDRASRSAIRRGQTIRLTESETVILDTLMSRPHQVVTKRELLELLGGRARTTNAVEVHVSSARRKLDHVGPELIETVHRRGYVFRPLPAADEGRRAALIDERDRLIRQRDEAIARRDEIAARRRQIVEQNWMVGEFPPRTE